MTHAAHARAQRHRSHLPLLPLQRSPCSSCSSRASSWRSTSTCTSRSPRWTRTCGGRTRNRLRVRRARAGPLSHTHVPHPTHLRVTPHSSRVSPGDVLVPQAHGATRRGRVRGRRLRRLRGDDGRRDPDRKGATPPPPSSPLRTTFLAASPASYSAHSTTRRRAPPSHQGTYFPGLLPLTYAYLEAIDCDPRPRRR